MPSPLELAREARQDRQKLILQTRELAERTDAEGIAEYEARMADVEALKAKYERLEKQAELEAETAKPDDEVRDTGTPAEKRERERGEAFHGFTQYKNANSTARFLALPKDQRDNPTPEVRALQMDIDEAGGYLVPPQRFVDRLIQAIDDEVFIRQFATVETVVGAQSLGAPSLDADPADPTWTSELLIGSEDTTMDVGKRELVPHPLAQFIKVSRKLIRHSTRAVDLVAERLGYKNGIVQEKAFMTGSSASQPLGVFTASAQGISTSADVSTGNTTTAFTTDGLIEAKYSLKSGYLRGARWMFHRDGVKMLAKLKDGDGQYIWHGSVVSGAPDMLLGIPMDTSEYAPNTFTTGLYVGILANWSYYWIADSIGYELQRLDELYAATNQVGFVSRTELDGAPVLEAAFARVTLA